MLIAWQVMQADNGHHVVPRRDTVEHTLDLHCVCGVSVEWVRGDCDCGHMHLGKVITHQAMDGRP